MWCFIPIIEVKIGRDRTGRDMAGQIFLKLQLHRKIIFRAASTPEIYEKKQYWLKRRRCSLCSFRQLTGNNISDHYFFLLSLLQTFFIKRLLELESKNLFYKCCLEHPIIGDRSLSRPRWPFWNPLAANLSQKVPPPSGQCELF